MLNNCRHTFLLDSLYCSPSGVGSQLALDLLESEVGVLELFQGIVQTIFPGLDLLFAVGLGVHLNAVWAQGFEAVEIAAVVGDFLVGVLLAGDPAPVG